MENEILTGRKLNEAKKNTTNEAVEEVYHQGFSVHTDIEHQALRLIPGRILPQEDPQQCEQQHEASRQKHVRVLFPDDEVDADTDHEEDRDHIQHRYDRIRKLRRQIGLRISADRSDRPLFRYDRDPREQSDSHDEDRDDPDHPHDFFIQLQGISADREQERDQGTVQDIAELTQKLQKRTERQKGSQRKDQGVIEQSQAEDPCQDRDRRTFLFPEHRNDRYRVKTSHKP